MENCGRFVNYYSALSSLGDTFLHVRIIAFHLLSPKSDLSCEMWKSKQANNLVMLKVPFLW